MTNPTATYELTLGDQDTAATAFRWANHCEFTLMRLYGQRLSREAARQLLFPLETFRAFLYIRAEIPLPEEKT